MAKDLVFNETVQNIVFDNLEIFKYEYPELKKDLDDYKKKPNCKCRGKIFKKFQEDEDKFNSIVSKFMEEEVNIHFSGPLKESIVKEFSNITEVQEFLTELQNKGKIVRTTSISPSKDSDGYILIAM